MNSEPTPPSRLRLLHVEDSAADAELIEAVLVETWPTCSIARVQTRVDFVGAIEHEQFDLILSDFSMPGFDGLTALALARQMSPLTPFVFLSGTIGEDNAAEALKRGATDYVIKDRMGRLVPAVRRALQEKAEQRWREEAERRLRESQERFQQLAEQSSEIFWFVALNPERILYIGPAIEQIWGRPAETFYTDPRAWIEAIHSADRARVARSYAECISGVNSYYDEEYRVIRPDGTLRWVQDSGTIIRDAEKRPIRLSGIAKDITQRKATEQRLRQQAQLLDQANDAISMRDLADRVLYWNHAAERIYGYTVEELRERPATETPFHRANSLVFAVARRSAMAHGEWSGEHGVVNKSGQSLQIMARWTLVRDDTGAPSGILCIETDVTEQRRVEKLFLRSQRLESVGLLAGGIAHDLNNALTPILMAVDLLQQTTPDAGQRRLLSVLESSAKHGSALIKQVLAFARGVEGAREALPPRLVIRDFTQLLGETLPRSIVLDTHLPTDLWLVKSNSTEFSQVIMNLCVNARDAMPQGGRLTITGKNVTVDAALAGTNPGARPGPYVLVTVADTGSGIPPEILDRIFDPFFTTKAPGKGTGLGLATVLGIVKSHEGFLQVQSEVGRGSEFRLYFPAVDAAGAKPEPAAARPTARGAGKTILLIDDEETVRLVIQGVLKAWGYDVIAVDHGEAGVAVFRERAAEIAAVVTDMMMPTMQGPEVISAPRAIEPDVRIVAMSGLLEANCPIRAEAGRLAFLAKPMTGAALLRAIEEVSGGAPTE